MTAHNGTTTPPGDFRTDKRMILLCVLALPIGAIGAVVAKLLLWLIALITNLVFYFRLSSANVTPEGNHLGAWVIAVPVIGALIIGLMARYGSEKIRGHGIPEALEAILLGRSLIQPKVAILKPISSAISIGTGGPFGAEGTDHHDRRSVWVDLRAIVQFDLGGTKDVAGGGSGGRDVRGLRHSGGGSAAGG
jgi:hypothetical protein